MFDFELGLLTSAETDLAKLVGGRVGAGVGAGAQEVCCRTAIAVCDVACGFVG